MHIYDHNCDIIFFLFFKYNNKMQRYTIFLLLSLLYMFQAEKPPETCIAMTVIRILYNVASCWLYKVVQI